MSLVPGVPEMPDVPEVLSVPQALSAPEVPDDEILAELPGLRARGFERTSDPTTTYNCHAWAAGDDTRYWSPQILGGYYWPPDLPRDDFSVENFVAAYGGLGYEICEDGTLQEGIEKIAIYGHGDRIRHSARQLEDGGWTSKLGSELDIRHETADAVECPTYGTVRLFLARPRRDEQPTLTDGEELPADDEQLPDS